MTFFYGGPQVSSPSQVYIPTPPQLGLRPRPPPPFNAITRPPPIPSPSLWLHVKHSGKTYQLFQKGDHGNYTKQFSTVRIKNNTVKTCCSGQDQFKGQL